MTTTTDAELHPCLCGCGTLVAKNYARGHWARGQQSNRGLRPLPGPNDELPDDDGDEELPAELTAELDEMDQLDWLDAQSHPEPSDQGPAPDDPPPSRLRGPRATPGPRKGKTRVTVTVQRDVQAKIRMVLVPAGRVWAMRDPMCGPVFIEQEPDISEALAEIVCDSPDLLNWFTGRGGYMKYFKLFMAVQPVLLVAWMHHVAHAGDEGAERQGPQQPAFAA